jgi:anti-anti-sigma regulatory factor
VNSTKTPKILQGHAPTFGGTHVALMARTVEFRIDVTSDEEEVVVHVAGRLAGDAVPQLRTSSDSIEGAFVLDLSKLLIADDAGIAIIREIAERGSQVRGSSPFVQLLLDDGT